MKRCPRTGLVDDFGMQMQSLPITRSETDSGTQ